MGGGEMMAKTIFIVLFSYFKYSKMFTSETLQKNLETNGWGFFLCHPGKPLKLSVMKQ